MKLSQHVKRQIASTLVDAKFSEEINNLQNQIRDFGPSVYNAAFDKTHRDIIALMPEDWCSFRDNFSAYLGGVYCSFTLPVKYKFPSGNEYLKLDARSPIVSDHYYPSSGSRDWQGCFETEEEAENYVKSLELKDDQSYYIINLADWIY